MFPDQIGNVLSRCLIVVVQLLLLLLFLKYNLKTGAHSSTSNSQPCRAILIDSDRSSEQCVCRCLCRGDDRNLTERINSNSFILR